MVRVPHIVSIALEATKKPVERICLPSRCIGSFKQQIASGSLSESSGAIGDMTTNKAGTAFPNVACSGSVPRLQSAFQSGVDQMGDNGINSGCEVSMCENNMLQKLPDGYVIGDRHIDGQSGRLVFALSPLAREAASRLGGGLSQEVKVLIVWVPDCNGEDVAPTLEAQGAEVSCV